MEFESLYRELENSMEMIRALLSGIAQEESQVRPAPESWSMLEVICHLYDEEREDFREHVDFILHRQNEDWHQIDPQGWVTARNYNEQNFAGMQIKFFAEREKSLRWLRGLPHPDWETTYISTYGTTTAGELLACWVAHDNLHIRQLVELRRHRIERLSQPHPLDYAGEW
ncbi:MAG TPA: DinB family protein [Anaerolineales bacterium]|nr:DinB family protein [Anaerolineales bacterium]